MNEKDTKDELRKEKTDEAHTLEAKLVKVGQELREATASRTEKETKDEKKGQKNEPKPKRNNYNDDEEWNVSVNEQLKAKSKQEIRASDLLAQELQLMRERFDQEQLNREAAREQNQKQLQLLSAFINKMN